MKLQLIFYENQFTSFDKGEPVEMTWLEFRDEILRVPEIVQDKGAETQFFPGSVLESASNKGDSAVDRIYLFCLDADEITEEEYNQILETIEKEKLEAVVYSTHSHFAQQKKDGKFRVRFIFPLKRPVLAAEWRIFWANSRLAFGAVADPTTANPGKHYLVPSTPPSEEAQASRIYLEFQGNFLDPDEMMSRYGIGKIAESEMVSFDLGKESVTGTMFHEMLKQRRKGDELKTANSLKAALGKLPYAESGTRENTLFAIAGLLAKEFPRGNPDDICEPLRYSIEIEEARGGPKFTEFRDKVIRRQRDILRRAAEKQLEAAKETGRQATIQASITSFTEENLAGYIKQTKGRVVFRDLKNQLVLVHLNGYYVFNGKGYTYATATSLPATVRGCLQHRAEESLDFSYYYPTDGGKPPEAKSNDALVRDHGDFIEEVRYTHIGSSYFDKEKKILWLCHSETPARILPQRIPEVEAWMRAFTGGDEGKLKLWEEWMARYQDTNRALAGLVLMGPTGTGKTAFATGMGYMFGDAPPCSMKNYLADFNSQILRNPLVFADENMPEVKGRVPTDTLRSMISESRHEVNNKGRPIVILDGFVRTILAIQTLKKFNFGQGHEKEDIEAIEKRFLFIQAHSEAAKLFDFDLFVNEYGLVKHARYLSQKIPANNERFGIDTSGMNFVIAGDPVVMAVADWLIEYLSHKVYNAAEVKPNSKKVSAFINNKKIFANVTMMRKEWEDYSPVKARTPMNQQALLDAVRSLSVGPKAHRIRMGTGMESYWELNIEVIKARAVAIDMLSEEQFDLLLEIPHELSFENKTYALSDEDKMRRMQAISEYRGKAS